METKLYLSNLSGNEVTTARILQSIERKQRINNAAAAEVFPYKSYSSDKLEATDYFVTRSSGHNAEETSIAQHLQILVAPKKIKPIIATSTGRFERDSSYIDVQGSPLYHILITQHSAKNINSVTLTLRRYKEKGSWDPKKIVVHIPNTENPDEYYLHIQDMGWRNTKATVTTYMHLENGQFSSPQRITNHAVSQFAPQKISAILFAPGNERKFDGVPQHATVTNNNGIGVISSLEKGFSTIPVENRTEGSFFRIKASLAELLINPSEIVRHARGDKPIDQLSQLLEVLWTRVDEEALINNLHLHLAPFAANIPITNNWQSFPPEQWYKYPSSTKSPSELFVCSEKNRIVLLLKRQIFSRQKRNKSYRNAVLTISSLNYIPTLHLFDCEINRNGTSFTSITDRAVFSNNGFISIDDFISHLSE